MFINILIRPFSNNWNEKCYTQKQTPSNFSFSLMRRPRFDSIKKPYYASAGNETGESAPKAQHKWAVKLHVRAALKDKSGTVWCICVCEVLPRYGGSIIPIKMEERAAHFGKWGVLEGKCTSASA